jgi:hypothetical protein
MVWIALDFVPLFSDKEVGRPGEGLERVGFPDPSGGLEYDASVV